MKGQRMDPCAGGNVLYLDCPNTGILDTVLCYSFTTFSLGRDEVKGTWDLSVLFLKFRCEFTNFV